MAKIIVIENCNKCPYSMEYLYKISTGETKNALGEIGDECIISNTAYPIDGIHRDCPLNNLNN